MPFEMPFTAMQKALESGGVFVKLGHVAGWTPAEREEARLWIVAAWKAEKRPKFLDEFLVTTNRRLTVDIPPDELNHAQATAVMAADSLKQSPEFAAAVKMEVDAAAFPDTKINPPTPTYPSDKKDARPPLFVSANRGPRISPDVARIVETLYAADAFRDYEELEKNLEVGEQRGDYATLREHLDKAERRARKAHQLYLGVKLERANYDRDAAVTLAAMRQKAHDELEDEKGAGERKKMITDADVMQRVAEKFPDEWRAQEQAKDKLKGTESSIEHLVKMWDAKCYSLRTLLETLRK
jgi:hypothetical protein